MGRALRVLIGMGPTREPIDPVRFISNYSTGYMGARLAAEALARGHQVTVVNGPSRERLSRGIRAIPVEQAREMERTLRQEARKADAIIMAAAVSDFRPVRCAASKLPRRNRLRLSLEATPDILARLPRRQGQVIAGFALETAAVLSRARRKLRRKRLDLLVAQWAAQDRPPFGRRRVRAWLLARDGTTKALGDVSKPAVARVLLDKVEALWYGQRGSTKNHHATAARRRQRIHPH